MQRQDPQIVDAVGVVGVFMGVEHRLDPIDLGLKHLFAQVAAGIDQDARWRVAALAQPSSKREHLQRRLRGSSGSQSPQTLPMRGTPPDDPQPSMVAMILWAAGMGQASPVLANSRAKLAVVSRPSCSRGAGLGSRSGCRKYPFYFLYFIYCSIHFIGIFSSGTLDMASRRIPFKLGVLDFAGGTVVHISAGMAALAGALVLKRRKSHIEHKEVPPANIPYVLIGTGLLWFGWFGFNAGSALGASSFAVSAFLTTNTAAGAAGLSWMFFDVSRGKKPSVLGFCIGAVVGLVAITPGAGFVSIPPSIFIGAVAAVISNLALYHGNKKLVLMIH